jgi:copper resistance protein C
MMKNLSTLVLASVACAFAATAAFAHAFLDHAVPGVGATVSASPAELELSFTQNIVPAFSGVEIASAEGGAVPAAKPVVDSGSPNVMHVRLGQGLKAGVYVVHWHVVSVDTHRTSGSYKFTVAP